MRIDTSLAVCSRCGTRLKNGGFTYCAACGYENYSWLARIAEKDAYEYEQKLKKQAIKAGFNSIAEHSIWRDKISRIEENQINKVRSIEKLFYPIMLPIISLLISILIIPTWWFIFKLIFAVIIYIILYFLIADIFEIFDNKISNLKHKYYEISYDSSLLKDNGKLKNSIPKVSEDDDFTENEITYPNEVNIKENKKLEVKQRAKVIENDNYLTIEFEPFINQNIIEQIRAFIKTIPNNNSKKIVINGEGKNIRNIDYKDVKLLIEFLETLSIYTKNKKNYK
jgi:ribosomal protein L37E